MQSINHLHAALLAALMATPLPALALGAGTVAASGVAARGLAASAVAASAVAPAAPAKFAAKTDSRGYIDVWALRHDVAMVEAMQTPHDPNECTIDREGEEEMPPGMPTGEDDEHEPTPDEIKAEAQARAQHEAEMERQAEEDRRREKECVERETKTRDAYEAVRRALNDAWLPALTEAMKQGDRVAEVILRQCSTTPVLDRSGIESTCDPVPEKKKIAAQRLKATGFAPAWDLTQEPGYPDRGNGAFNSPAGRMALQKIALAAVAEGNLGAIPYEATGCDAEDRDFTRASRLITVARQSVGRAFTYSSGGDNPDVLLLVRQADLHKEMTWGQATLATMGQQVFFDTILTTINQPHPVNYDRLDRCWGVDNDTWKDVNALIDAEAASIDRYLKEDPRWAVFLQKRVGNDDWLPADQELPATKLEAPWMGHWVLDKYYENLEPSKLQQEGSADIYLDGATPRITIKTSVSQPPGLDDLTGCTLRESGGLTPPMKKGSPRLSVLGDLNKFVRSASYNPTTEDSNWVNKETGLVRGMEPFEEGQRYRQILMQCQNAEGGGDAVRFLLLGRDAAGTEELVEVATLHQLGFPIYLRHFKRPRELGTLDVLAAWVKPAQDSLTGFAVRLIVSVVLFLGAMWWLAYMAVKIRRK